MRQREDGIDRTPRPRESQAGLKHGPSSVAEAEIYRPPSVDVEAEIPELPTVEESPGDVDTPDHHHQLQDEEDDVENGDERPFGRQSWCDEDEQRFR